MRVALCQWVISIRQKIASRTASIQIFSYPRVIENRDPSYRVVRPDPTQLVLFTHADSVIEFNVLMRLSWDSRRDVVGMIDPGALFYLHLLIHQSGNHAGILFLSITYLICIYLPAKLRFNFQKRRCNIRRVKLFMRPLINLKYSRFYSRFEDSVILFSSLLGLTSLLSLFHIRVSPNTRCGLNQFKLFHQPSFHESGIRDRPVCAFAVRFGVPL